MLTSFIPSKVKHKTSNLVKGFDKSSNSQEPDFPGYKANNKLTRVDFPQPAGPSKK